jgi:hypothetical protein
VVTEVSSDFWDVVSDQTDEAEMDAEPEDARLGAYCAGALQ